MRLTLGCGPRLEAAVALPALFARFPLKVS
ncbi:cytochrome P450 [Streptomyces kanamyceticus]|nr:cytochrome P450 [Streptomyces kanamyceticus]